MEHELDFQFARDGQFSCWTLEYLPSGSTRVRSVEGQCVYGANSAMLIPPLTPYVVEWGGGEGTWQEFYIVFDPAPAWHSLLTWPLSDCGLGHLDLPHVTVRREVESVFASALEISQSAHANRQALVLNALERLLLLLDEINPARGYAQQDERIEQVLEYISKHYPDHIDLAVLARQVHLSPSRFSHLFRSHMRMAPMQYVEQYRLERAAEKLMFSRDSIERLASATGFVNALYFATRFRRHFGQTPSGYRRNPKRPPDGEE